MAVRPAKSQKESGCPICCIFAQMDTSPKRAQGRRRPGSAKSVDTMPAAAPATDITSPDPPDQPRAAALPEFSAGGPLRILLLEDNPADAELIAHQLTRAEIPHTIRRVDTEADFLRGLREFQPHLILTDYRLPSFDGLAALVLAQEECPETPCIFISGVLGEEAAIESLKQGATDYVLKHRLQTLAPAVKRALQEAGERSARRRAEEALRRSERLLAEAERIAHLGSWEWEPQGNLTVSEEVCRIFRFDHIELHPALHTLTEAVYHADRKAVARHIEEACGRPRAMDWHCRIQHLDGEVRVLHVRGQATAPSEDGRSGLIGTIQDVTEMKQAEDALRRQAIMLETIFDGVFITDMHGRVTDWNSAAERIFGHTRQEVLGKPLASLYRPKEAAARVREMIADAARGECCTGEIRFLRRDGTEGACEAILEPLTDRSGQPLAIMGVSRDTGERKRFEQLLFQSQKMEALSLLARAAAQNFNSFLTVVMGLGERLLNSLEPGDPRREWAAEIVRASQRSSTLTDQLLTFGHREAVQAKAVDLNVLLTGSRELLYGVLGEGIHLVTVPGPRLWRVKADLGQMEQLLMNLVINARDAMPDGGVLTMQTANTRLTEEFTRLNRDVKPGNYVALAVSDTGLGMDAETQAQVFDPFFTTKNDEKATGLGLSVVYGIIKRHRGHILIDSKVGEGTTVTVYLPRAEGNGP
jgi:PAS domain S-box-containing protein